MLIGYIKVWRKCMDSVLWRDKPFGLFQAFLYLILRAAWKDHEVWYQATAIQLKRGQLSTTERQLARDFGWSRKKVHNFLQSLENSTMASTTRGPRHLVITITNYETYQGDDENGDHKGATGGTTEEPVRSHRGATREEVNKNRQEGNKNAAPTPSPLTAAPAPQNGTQQPDGPTANDDPPIPDSAVEHFNAGRLREALSICVDAGCYYNARRLAMKLGDLKEMDRITKRIEEVRNGDGRATTTGGEA